MNTPTLLESLCRACASCSLSNRWTPTLAISLVICLGGFFSTPSSAQVIQWFPDIPSATQTAKDKNKLILVHFTATWCNPCRDLETFVFTSPEVQRAFANNVVAVKIDVDSSPSLVQEYGVASVPFDVAITPDGRVVSKRKSPVDAVAYHKMVNDFHVIIHSLANNDSPGLNQNLDELKTAIHSLQPKFEGQPTSFTPDAPSYQAPSPSDHSAELKRSSRFITNPYVPPKTQLAGQQVANAFTPDQNLSPPSTQFHPPAEFTPSGNFAPTGEFAAPGNFTPSGNFRSKKTDPKSLFPARVEPPNAFVPTTTDPSFDNRNVVVASQGTGFGGSKGQVQRNPFVPQEPVEPAMVPDPQAQPEELAFNTNAPENNFRSPSDTLEPNPVESGEEDQSRIDSAKAEPKIVMDDKFFGRPTAMQLEMGSNSGIYHARINLPQPGPNDFVPPGESVSDDHGDTNATTGESTLAETADGLDRPFQRPRTTAIPASSSKIVSVDASPADPIENGLDMAAIKTTKPKYALHGKCPVTLLTESKWVDGDPQWGCVHRNRIYIFKTEQNLKIFQSDPDANSPILAGYDPVVYQETGRLVDGLEKHGVFMGKAPHQRIVLFANAETRARFQSEPKKYLEAVKQAMLQTGASSNLLR